MKIGSTTIHSVLRKKPNTKFMGFGIEGVRCEVCAIDKNPAAQNK